MTEHILAPILVSVYHRLDCLKRCVESLLRNPEAKDSEIWIVSDAAAKPEHEEIVRQVREYILSIRGFKEVHPVFHEKNQGAGFSVIPTAEDLRNRYGRLIAMEDDIIAAPDYLRYMNDGLEFFKDDKRIYSICAFKLPFDIPSSYWHDIYFSPFSCPWGVATWKDRREDIDCFRPYDRYNELRKEHPELFQRLLREYPIFMGILKDDSEGRLNAWDVRQDYYSLTHSKMCVFPTVSRSQNWGFDPRSDHCTSLEGVTIPRLADEKSQPVRFETVEVVGGVNDEIMRRFYRMRRVQPLLRRVLANLQWFGVRKTAAFYCRRIKAKLGCGV